LVLKQGKGAPFMAEEGRWGLLIFLEKRGRRKKKKEKREIAYYEKPEPRKKTQ